MSKAKVGTGSMEAFCGSKSDAATVASKFGDRKNVTKKVTSTKCGKKSFGAGLC